MQRINVAKLVINILLIVVMLNFFTTLCLAENYVEINNHGAELSEEQILEIKLEEEAKDALLNVGKENESLLDEIIPLGPVYLMDEYLVNVTINQQATYYYCGPASVRQSLSFHKYESGSSTSLPSQSQLASLAGTTTSGSTTVGLRNAINNYTSVYDFNNYVVGNIKDKPDPIGVFRDRIKNNIRYKNSAPVVLVSTQYLSWYNGYATCHFMTVSGYRYYDNGLTTMRAVDPNKNDLYYGTRWENMGSYNTNGLFRAVYERDLISPNYAMLY